MRKLRPRQEHRATPGHTARARTENQAFLPAPQLPLLVEAVVSQARYLTGKPFVMSVFCCLQTGSLPLRWTLTSDSHLPHSSEQSEATRHHPCAMAPPAARSVLVGDGHGPAHTAQHPVRTGGHLHTVCLPPHKREHGLTSTWPQPSSSWAQCTVKGLQSAFPLTVTTSVTVALTYCVSGVLQVLPIHYVTCH